MVKLRYFAFLVFFYVDVSTFSTECDTIVTFSVERAVHKEGFHRDVVTNVSWSHNDPRDGDCSMLLLNHIPPEMFVDLDEINRHELVNTKVLPLGEKRNFDVERPAHLSRAQTLLVYLNVNKQIQHRPEGKHWQLTSLSVLPVHWRYQKPSDNQLYVTVSLPGPAVMALCKDNFTSDRMQECFNQLEKAQYPCNHNTMEMCNWFVLNNKLDDKGNDMIFTVPVGVKKHSILVASGTMFVTLTATYILMRLPRLDVSNVMR